jgi:Protein of unknown function (DUF3667)
MAIEAAGDVITGGLIARAIEPGAGEDAAGADGFTHEKTCLNCTTVLTGAYCHACGQHAHIHRTLGALAHDLLHGVFHFEGKVWRTIPLLFWKPGDLTRRYIHGERAKFVSPLALFLFSVFLMFSIFESVGGPIGSNVNLNGDGKPKTAAELKVKIEQASQRVDALRKKREAAVAAKQPTEALDEEIDSAESYRNGLAAATVMTGKFESADWNEGATINTGSKEFDDHIRDALKNPKLLLYKLQSSAYKFSWALIPLSLPFLWLMFAWKRQYKLYDHAVFVTYSITFVMLLLIIMSLMRAAGLQPGWAALLLPVNFYRQLQQAYGLRWFSALWRTIALLITSFTVLLVFGLLLLMLGVIG